MIITTAKGMKFDTEIPAKSNVIMVLNNSGNQCMDKLKLTGKQTVVKIDREDTSMIEVEHSFGIDEVCEDFLWQ